MKKLKASPYEGNNVFYYKDILNTHIVPKLSSMSLLSLVRADKKIRNILSDSVYNIVREKVFKFLEPLIDRQSMISLIYNAKLTLTGSALLVGLLEDNWLDTVRDIDLVQTAETDADTAPDLFKYMSCDYNTRDITELPTRTRYEKNDGYSDDLNGIIGITNYHDMMENNQVYLQVITVIDIETYSKSFDYVFCANFLNDKSLKIKFPYQRLQRDKKIIRLPRCIFFKPRDRLHDFRFYLKQKYERILKYNQRGWDIRFEYGYHNEIARIQKLCKTNNEYFMAGCYMEFWRERIFPDGTLKILTRKERNV